MIDKLSSIFSRIIFVVAGIMVVIAILDWFLQLFGWTFSWLSYEAGRLFEFATMMMVFIIAVLLRQIREALIKSK